MGKTRFKSDAFEAIHSAASGLHEAGVIDKKTMKDFDETCIMGNRVIARHLECCRCSPLSQLRQRGAGSA